MIYLDYSATTPVDKRVLDDFVKVTEDYIANISCYITENGFEFFSDRSISRITLDRDVSDLEHWETVYLTDTKNFIFDATELTVDGKSYNSTPTDSE